MWDVVAVAVALGLSNMAASIGIGLSGVDGSVRARVATVFGFFEAAMPFIGLLIGHRLAAAIGSATTYLGGGLVVAVGLYATLQARRGRPAVSPDSSRRGLLLVTGAALSVDNLVVGFALGAHKVSVVLAAVVIAVVSVVMSLVGLEVGSRLGTSVERWSSEFGGIVLVLVGVAMMTQGR